MQEIAPSLTEFYTVAAILFLMLLVAGISLYFNAHNITRYQRILFWAKLTISILLLFLGIGLASHFVIVFGVFMFVSGGLSQALVFLALVFVPIIVYALTVWGLIRWSRNRRFADASVIIVIIIFVSYVFLFQRPWLCVPFSHIGIGSEQECTTKEDRDLKELLDSVNR